MDNYHVFAVTFCLSNLLGLCFHCLSFCIAFVIAAVGASDFCIGTPDDKVTAILNNNRDQLDSIIYYGVIGELGIIVT